MTYLELSADNSFMDAFTSALFLPHTDESFPLWCRRALAAVNAEGGSGIMTLTLAVVGKGGTGKTTFAALTIKYLLETGRTPILAIDADPSANLNLALGMELERYGGPDPRGDQRQVSGGHLPDGHLQARLVPVQSEECLVEGEGVDLLAMGRPEGPGCYCAANHMLREAHRPPGQRLSQVVIDNEAGMEHISRQTTRDVDRCSSSAIPLSRPLGRRTHRAAGAMLGTRIGRVSLVINNVRGRVHRRCSANARGTGVPAAGHVVPHDPADQPV